MLANERYFFSVTGFHTRLRHRHERRVRLLLRPDPQQRHTMLRQERSDALRFDLEIGATP